MLSIGIDVSKGKSIVCGCFVGERNIRLHRQFAADEEILLTKYTQGEARSNRRHADRLAGASTPARLPEDTYRELQLLARQYYQMTSVLIKAKVDFNALCDQVLPGMRELMNDHAGRHKLSDFVLRYHHTTHILEMGETRFRYPCASQCAIHTDRHYGSDTSHHSVEASRDTILAQMQAFAKTLPEYSLVCEMPCIGDTLAPRLIAEIGDVRRFHSKRTLIAYAGIDAPPYQSGKFRANNRHISKRGNRCLRKTGYEVMQSYVMHTITFLLIRA